jgi:type IV secretory pathway VirB4 component
MSLTGAAHVINTRRMFRDYQESGALSALVGIETAIDEHTYATRGGDLVTFLAMRGVDYECLEPGQIDGFARRFEAAARVFDERFRIYQYQLKSEHPSLPAHRYANPVVEEAVASRRRHLASKARRLYSGPMNSDQAIS